MKENSLVFNLSVEQKTGLTNNGEGIVYLNKRKVKTSFKAIKWFADDNDELLKIVDEWVEKYFISKIIDNSCSYKKSGIIIVKYNETEDKIAFYDLNWTEISTNIILSLIHESFNKFSSVNIF